MYSDFVPKFVKQYAHLGDTMKEAIRSYIDEVGSGAFPAEDHTFKIEDEVIDIKNTCVSEGLGEGIKKAINNL